MDAAAAVRALASRGSHADAIREAGGIPLLLTVLEDGAGDDGVEHASGALAHLLMQRAANREALYAAGGVPLLVALLQEDNQAAEYAASTLGTLVMCGSPAAARAVQDAVNDLPAGKRDDWPPSRSISTPLSRRRPVWRRHAGQLS